jgi:hypothetical protein
MVFVGLISYSLYLWHWPILFFVRYATLLEPSAMARGVGVILAVVVASLSWRFVEEPFRKKHGVLKRPALFAVAGMSMVFFVVLGMIPLWGSGLPGRFGPELAWAVKGTPRYSCVPAPPPYDPDAKQLCLLGASNAEAATFIVWGDSHAEAFAPAFDSVARQHDRGGLLSCEFGCPPIVGVEKRESNTTATVNRACAQRNDLVLAFAKAHPGIASIFLVARWQYYASGVGYGSDQFHRVELFDKGGERLAPAAIESRLEDTLRTLLELGREVFLVEPPPEFSLDIPEGLARVTLLRRDAAVLDQSRGDVLARNAMFARVAAHLSKEPRFHVVPTSDLYCRDEVCRGYDANGPLYSDNNHIGRGSEFLMSQRLGLFLH